MGTDIAPVFGETEDFSEIDDIEIVPFTLVGYDFVPNPTSGERKPHPKTFHAKPRLPGEKVIGMYGRAKRRGDVDIESMSKLILSMLVPEEREEFLDFIEDVNLVFIDAAVTDTVEYLVEKAIDPDGDLPKLQSRASSAGRKGRGGRTSTAVHSGRAALPRESSRQTS
jgi:hypothetical protein